MKTALELLKKHWGYEAFRPLQAQIIEASIAGTDVLAVLPTGAGKSLCFQIAGLKRGGLTLVVSPLIALMKDQVQNLEQRGLKAAYIEKGQSAREIDRILTRAEQGDLQFLYLSPERLTSTLLQKRLPALQIGLIAVDEAHCISQWGYDFRPAYSQILAFRKLLPGVPVMAVTATATLQVQGDILEGLGMEEAQIFRTNVFRPNLRFVVRQAENRDEKLLEILNAVKGSAIVYVKKRQTADKLARLLRQEGHEAAAFHAGLPTYERYILQDDWAADRLRVLVATTAFGMGVDKPNVRLVVHYNLPQDLESYYQEAGRAGRDSRSSFCVLLYDGPEASALVRKSGERYPGFDTLKRVYDFLCDVCRVDNLTTSPYYYELNSEPWAKALSMRHGHFQRALQMLSDLELIELNETIDSENRFRILVNPEEARALVKRELPVSPVLDGLMRLKGAAAFTEICFLNLRELSRKIQLSEMVIRQRLDALAWQKVISFDPAGHQTALRFLLPRQNLQPAQFPREFYEQLNRLQRYRAEQLLHYAEERIRCRSAVISSYFGQELTQDCGVCDNCTERKARRITEEQTIAAEILQLLASQHTTRSQLLKSIRAGSPELREEVLNKLVDTRQVETTDDGRQLLLPEGE